MKNTYTAVELFSLRLREARQEQHLMQKDIAEKLGVPVSTYANWEQGRREPSIHDIFELLRILDIEANDLFDKNSLYLK